MTTFVLVHGAWHGAWCWREVAPVLGALGHRVVTPTLTGLGERTGELTPEVGLSTHVDDVTATLDALDANSGAGGGPVLVLHSYAGMVGPAVLRRRSVGRVVVLDGFMPGAGERALDLLPTRAAEHYTRSAIEHGDGWRVPPRPMANLGVTDGDLIERVAPLLTDHPLRTYTDPSTAGYPHGGAGTYLHGGEGTYLLCDGWASPFAPSLERATELGWDTRRLDADHEIMLSAPQALVDALAAVAEAP